VPLRNFRTCGDLRQNQGLSILRSWPGWRASETVGPFTWLGHAHIFPSSSTVRKIYHHSPQSSAFYAWSRTAAFTYPRGSARAESSTGSVPPAAIQQARFPDRFLDISVNPSNRRDARPFRSPDEVPLTLGRERTLLLCTRTSPPSPAKFRSASLNRSAWFSHNCDRCDTPPHA
jgi:hypothetical protein